MNDFDLYAAALASSVPAEDVDILMSTPDGRKALEKAFGKALKKVIDRMRRPPAARGPKEARTPVQLRQLARKVRRLMAASHFPSRNAALPHFVKRLGAAARANVSRDKHKVIAPRTLGNLVGQGEALLDFMDDPRFRRWANALRTELAAGAKRRFWREVRAVLKDDKPGDLSELAAQADQAEAYRSAAEQALLGDRWPDSFITFEK